MIGHVPENVLEDILSRIDIVEIISGSIPLKRAGRNFKANCPFHHEKTASFLVSPDRQIYHCFGCGESGNAFKFLMRYERLDFPEAIEVLAAKANVILPEAKDKDAKFESISSQLLKANEAALCFYENNLKTPACSAARNYLEKRQIKLETMRLFRLGAALKEWDGLIQYSRSKSLGISLLEKAGLVLSKESGGYYDRFRNRVIFPIFDIKSRPVGFGARFLPEESNVSVDAGLYKNAKAGAVKENSQPKYVNSPETPVYTKGKFLYGLNFAKDAIRDNDCAVIVEGYLDCIIPFQAGVNNIVASLGTALTVEQVRLLKRYTHNAVMVYDADNAGELATLRSLDLFIEEGMQVKVAALPAGYDPDLFVRKHGADAFKDKISNAKTLFDYKIGVLRTQFGSETIEARSAIASQVLVTIAKFSNAVLKSEYIKKLSEELEINEESLWQEVNKIKKAPVSLYAKEALEPKDTFINPAEKLLIKLMLEENEFINRIQKHLEPADFQNLTASRIVSVMFSLFGEGRRIDAAALSNKLGDDDIMNLICESSFMPDIIEQEKEKIVDDCIERLKKESLKLKQNYLHDMIKQAQHSGDEDKLNKLMHEFHLLIKKG